MYIEERWDCNIIVASQDVALLQMRRLEGRAIKPSYVVLSKELYDKILSEAFMIDKAKPITYMGIPTLVDVYLPGLQLKVV